MSSNTWQKLGLFLGLGLMLGFMLGYHVAQSNLYNDCRVAGATRLGSSAFKCEQYSKAVLLMPAEQARKEKK
jgi:hypothetical protein